MFDHQAGREAFSADASGNRSVEQTTAGLGGMGVVEEAVHAVESSGRVGSGTTDGEVARTVSETGRVLLVSVEFCALVGRAEVDVLALGEFAGADAFDEFLEGVFETHISFGVGLGVLHEKDYRFYVH